MEEEPCDTVEVSELCEVVEGRKTYRADDSDSLAGLILGGAGVGSRVDLVAL